MTLISRRRNASIAVILSASLAVGLGAASPAFAVDNQVVPIASNIITTYPTDTLTLQLKQILANSNKFAVTTWWNTTKNFDSQAGSVYLNFGGTDEPSIRPAAAEAMALATALRFGAYDPVATGVSTADATAIALKLVTSVAYRHYSNTAGGWGTSSAPTSWGGNGWQSSLWANAAGTAAWLMWDSLSATDRGYVRTMVEAEANRYLTFTPYYYRNLAGTVLIPGDTKAEEMAWDGNILQLATAMMPNHANYSAWMNKRVQLSLAAVARPADVDATNGPKVINGKRLDVWLTGSNAFNDGTVVNHGIVHPEYQTFPSIILYGAVDQALAGRPVPYADLRGFPAFYNSIVTQTWTAGPKPAQYNVDSSITHGINAPGGVVYASTATGATDTTDIYFPMGNDWGTGNRVNFLQMDVFAATIPSLYGALDAGLPQGGAYWAPVHAQKILNQQARFTDGHTYLNTGENSYAGREEMVGQIAAYTYLARLLGANSRFSVTNAGY